MRKKLLLFTAVVMAALVMVLSGCGSSADKGSASGDKKVIMHDSDCILTNIKR